MPRRKDPEIYTYKLKSGKERFGFKTYVGLDAQTHKPVKVTRQGFKTYKEAEQAKYQIKADGADKVISKNKAKKNAKTFSEVWDMWLPIQRVNVKGSSLNTIKGIWKNHLEREFGDVYVNSVTPEHIQKFVNDCAENYRRYRPLINLLHRLIKFAIKRDYREHDPFEKIIIPRKSKLPPKYKHNFYERDELELFLNAAKDYSLKYYCFFMILSNLGIRRGEAVGLKWSDIDWDNKQVHIQRTISFDEDGNTDVNSTKSQAGDRILSLSDNLIEVLQEFYEKYDHESSEYIFHKSNGDHYANSSPETWIKNIYKKDEDLRKITLHGFRHTLASLIYDSDTPVGPKDVQYLLGHSSPALALDIYTHITKKQKKNIKKSINELDFK